jgi:hypothetical protein
MNLEEVPFFCWVRKVVYVYVENYFSKYLEDVMTVSRKWMRE